MRVLVQLLCLTGATAVFMSGPDADRFCDRGTKAKYDTSNYFCCPAACGGRCLAKKDDCTQEAKHNPDVYNPACCIPSAVEAGKSCKDQAAPCLMEKEWNEAQMAAYRTAQFDKATNQKTKKFAKIHSKTEDGKGPIANQQDIEDNYDAFYKESKPYKTAETNGDNPMIYFSNAFDGCQSLFRKMDSIRTDCVHADGTGKDELYGNHMDHKMNEKRKLGKNQFADYYWGSHSAASAEGFAACVAGKTVEKCGANADTAFGTENKADCEACAKFA